MLGKDKGDVKEERLKKRWKRTRRIKCEVDSWKKRRNVRNRVGKDKSDNINGIEIKVT